MDKIAGRTFAMAFQPAMLQEYVAVFYDQGFWSIGGRGGNASAIRGIPLAIVWLCEAGIILGFAGWEAHSALSDDAFCETCDCWTTVEKGVQSLCVDDAGAILSPLEQGDLQPLTTLPRAVSEDLHQLQLDLACCPQCTNSNYLTVRESTTTLDKKGKPETSTQTVLRLLRLDTRQVQQIRKAGVSPAEAASEATSA